MLKKIAVLLLTVPTSLALVGTAQASPTPTPTQTADRCPLYANVSPATSEAPWSVRFGTNVNCLVPPIVTLQIWKAESATGEPYASQVLVGTAFAGPAESNPNMTVIVPQIGAIQPDGTNELTGCFVQIDLAYGPPKANLSIAYGSNLIGAWHFGSQNCVNPPTVSPSATPSVSVTVTPPVPSSIPVTSVPVPSATPSASVPVATPTTPVTGTPSATPSPYASLVPPKVITRPTHKPSHKPSHKPTRKPHVKRTTPAPGVSASGCVGSPSCIPTPAKHKPAPKALPYTGTNTIPFTLTGLALIIGGTALKLTTRR